MIINSFLSSKVTAAHFYHTEYYIIVKLYKLYLILILFIFNNENSCFFSVLIMQLLTKLFTATSIR